MPYIIYIIFPKSCQIPAFLHFRDLDQNGCFGGHNDCILNMKINALSGLTRHFFKKLSDYFLQFESPVVGYLRDPRWRTRPNLLSTLQIYSMWSLIIGLKFNYRIQSRIRIQMRYMEYLRFLTTVNPKKTHRYVYM